MAPPAPGPRARSAALVCLTLVLAALAAWYGRGLATDNRVEMWATSLGHDPAYTLLLEQFGGDALVLVRVAGFDAERAGHAEFLDGLAARLAALPGAARAVDGLHLPGLRADGVAERLTEFEQRPLARAIGLGGAAAGHVDVFVVMEHTAGAAEARAFDAAFAPLRAEASALGLALTAAGHPFLSAALDRESQSVERLFGPLLVVSGFAVCALFLRSWALAGVALLPGLVGAVAVRAGLRLCGVPSNMILVAAGPLVFVVLVASMVHLAAAWRRATQAGMSAPEAARAARRATLRPAAMAAATTIVGFGVFAASDVSAVRELGLTVAAAVLLLVPLSYVAMPIALAGLGVPTARGGGPAARAWERVALAAAQRRGPVLAATAGLLALGVLAPRGMPVAVSAVDYFPAAHPVRAEYAALDTTSAGLVGLDVLVRAPGGVEPRAARELCEQLGRCTGVGAVFGPPAVVADLAALGPLAALVGPRVLRETGRLGVDGAWWRFTARASVNTPAEIAGLSADVHRAAADWSAAHGIEAHVAGSLLRLFALQEALVGTLARSLGLTALVALLSFCLCLRDRRALAAACVATLVPVAAVLAGARALGYALDAATVMVASAVVGLALDNTYHILLAGGPGGAGSRAARAAAFGRVGGAAVAGIVILAVGFGCLGLADFQPTARFGTLAALGFLGALVADVAVLPALWLPAGPAGAHAPAAVAADAGALGPGSGQSPAACSTES